MSDLMLHGVLNMPPEIWGDDELDKIQRHARYVEASDRIIRLEEIIGEMIYQKYDHLTLKNLLDEAKEFIESTK